MYCIGVADDGSMPGLTPPELKRSPTAACRYTPQVPVFVI